MSNEIYERLRETLDTIPNGFPKSKEGLDILILKKIFTEEEAELACDLKMNWETPETIAARTGRDREYLREKLREMRLRGEIFGAKINEVEIYKLMPYVFGIFEFQIKRMDREFADLNERYHKEVFAGDFFTPSPQMMKVVPIEKTIPSHSVVKTYESVKEIISNAKDWAVDECICKKEKGLLGHECSYPKEVCLGFAPIENYFKTGSWGRQISKDEAYAILDMSEKAGLVHLTSNIQKGHIFICNCCSCCCGVLRAANLMGVKQSVAHSDYMAVVDRDKCIACGNCEERCHVEGIKIDTYAEVNDRCIGCSLCVTTCPEEAITIQLRPDKDILDVPADEKDWTSKRGISTGRTSYKEKLL